VRLDDALRDADDELGFAIAQFGPEKARAYGDAIATARAKVAEAFRLRQALDDSVADSDRETREWTLQIIALCEQAEAVLARQDSAFTELRGLEVNAAGTLADVRARIKAGSDRVAAARSGLAKLAKQFAPSTLAAVAANPDAAEKALREASIAADAAAPAISASGVNAVAATLQESLAAAQRADQLLDAVDRTTRDLTAAADALEQLRASTTADLAEARVELDKAPDADSGRGIIDAIAAVEAALAASGSKDPVAELDRIGDAVADLDLALASARNQAQRLTHARAAYDGTLVSANSQIAVVRDLIGSRGGSVSARTRLAEAERQLMLAQAAADSDPVEALDAIRRAVTHARDADALARY
jgi:plasmid stabilization system protein ParE